MDNVLEVRDLFCGYGRADVLKGIDLVIRKGEILGIVGPNGAGKTTLFRVIAKIIEPKRGSILIEEIDIKSLTQREIAKYMAFVTQNLEVDPTMSVLDFVLLGRIPHRRPYQFFEDRNDMLSAEEALRATDLFHLKEKPLSCLSGGERQLAQISKALAQDPKILLLDEPLSHLDIAHAVRILNLLKKLNREDSLTEIVILHDLNLASEFCDRLVLLSDGKIVKDGSPKEVLRFDLIEHVYGTPVIVKENPLSLRPYVFPIFDAWMKAPPTKKSGASVD